MYLQVSNRSYWCEKGIICVNRFETMTEMVAIMGGNISLLRESAIIFFWEVQ